MMDKKPLAIFPSLPQDKKLVDENGNITATWSLFFDQLVQALQTNLKPEGSVVPQQTASNIALLTGSASLGNIIYDSTNDLFKGNIKTGPTTYTWKTFTLT